MLANVDSMTAARYFPHGCPATTHTCWSTFAVSWSNVGGRGLRPATRADPRRLNALPSWRRAFAPDQPTSAANRSRISPLAFFDAAQFAPASFFEISLRADFRLPIHPSNTTKPPAMHERFREHYSNEVRTPFREHFG
ncbi:hypothetical protein SAMN04489740_2518 [Arthrobacter alpinus]|uniref:Uncharacterized protein n=1 Tax=Arthrobacter alpinus TaxID=656366 RepID=A0A1H5LM94_9MICC|nr:hypothetical protein SAMN04489740_2518 [Arthrobacter alpinus]